MTLRRFQPSKVVNQIRPEPAVTFTVNGTLNFNRALCLTVPEGYSHCELLVDDEVNQLHVKLCAESGTDTLPIRVYRGYYVISVRKFLQWVAWSRTESVVYRARYVERARTVVVDLSTVLGGDGARDRRGRFTGHTSGK